MDNIQVVNQKLVSVTSRAMDILAAEIGVGLDELVDNVAFSDLGVDSLMSLTVSGRMREELEIDIHSHEFNDYPTIGQFTKFLSKFESSGPVQFNESPVSSSDSASDSPVNDFSTDEETDSAASTPVDDSASETGKGSEVTEIIRTTIAAEMGCDVEEIFDDADLASLGMDSLMSLTVLGAIRESTGLTMPADLLTVNKSIREIEAALGFGAPKRSAPKPTTSRKASLQAPPPAMETTPAKPARAASSVLLQGNSKRATKHLWMIPDGGGSATSYVEIPDLASDVAVWGLNSPYMKCPEEYNIGVVGMAERFITEMKRRQPNGPYLLAGWSAGGVIAFEAVNQLTKGKSRIGTRVHIQSFRFRSKFSTQKSIC